MTSSSHSLYPTISHLPLNPSSVFFCFFSLQIVYFLFLDFPGYLFFSVYLLKFYLCSLIFVLYWDSPNVHSYNHMFCFNSLKLSIITAIITTLCFCLLIPTSGLSWCLCPLIAFLMTIHHIFLLLCMSSNFWWTDFLFVLDIGNDTL